MRVPIHLIPVVVVVVASIGCAAGRVAFTPAMAEMLSDEELKGVQFFVAHKVILHRDITTAGQSVTPGGAVVFQNGKQIEEVLVKKGSPGVALGHDKFMMISVSFDAPVDGIEYSLRFDAAQRDAAYYLVVPVQKYGPQSFEVIDGWKKAYLEIDASRLDSIEARRRTATGRTVNGPN